MEILFRFLFGLSLSASHAWGAEGRKGAPAKRFPKYIQTVWHYFSGEPDCIGTAALPHGFPEVAGIKDKVGSASWPTVPMKGFIRVPFSERVRESAIVPELGKLRSRRMKRGGFNLTCD